MALRHVSAQPWLPEGGAAAGDFPAAELIVALRRVRVQLRRSIETLRQDQGAKEVLCGDGLDPCPEPQFTAGSHGAHQSSATGTCHCFPAGGAP